MENSNFNVIQPQAQPMDLARTFMAKVFTWMAVALFLSGFTAYLFGTSPEFISMLRVQTEMGIKTTGLGWFVMLSPFAFILVMSFGFQRLSTLAMVLLFIAFSAVMGMSISSIFMVYTHDSIYSIFGIAGGMFSIMAIAGYTTKTDLTRFGSLMVMGLIGIVIASLINMFIGSQSFSYFISFIGVLVFTGLTAYDVQTLKNIGGGIEYGNQAADKLAIMGAMRLYMDFLNLFLFLLNLFGKRD